MSTWVRIGLIVGLAILLWYLVIHTTEDMTGGATVQTPPAAPAPAAPN